MEKMKKLNREILNVRRILFVVVDMLAKLGL